MSRRNRYALDSSPLPPLPEVDTSSTIDSAQVPRVTKTSRRVRHDPGTREPSHAALATHSASSTTKRKLSERIAKGTGLQAVEQSDIPLADLTIPQRTGREDVAALNKHNDFADVPLGERPRETEKSGKSPSFLDDIRTNFVRGFSRQNERSHGQPASSSVYASSPPIFKKVPNAREAHVAQDKATGKSKEQAGLPFSFLDGPYSPPRASNQIRHTPSDISIPDGSTVGNIYKHYMYDDALDDFSNDGSLSDLDLTLPEVKPASPSDFSSQVRSKFPSRNSPLARHTSTFKQKLRLRTERAERFKPPDFSLPSVPHDPQQQGPSTGSGITQMNSYGNTRELLNLTPNPQVAGIQNSLQSIPDTPKLYIDAGDGNPVMYTDENEDQQLQHHRVPLEREVSNALRRASGQSAYSTGSIADSIIDRYRHFGQKAHARPFGAGERSRNNHVETTPPLDTDLNWQAAMIDSSDQPYTFYDEGVVPSDWVHGPEHSVVRIPISHASPPHSPALKPKAYLVLPESAHHTATDDGNNDWETVGTRTSLFGSVHDQSPSFGMIGGTVGRAGSSIADISDEGLSNNTFEVDDLRSTNRIAQHPAQSGYLVDYRQRSLKDTRAPVFAPRYRIHNVNGFLANSSRLQPQPSESSQNQLPSLGKNHTNPFIRTPPQFLDIQTPPSSGSSAKVVKHGTGFKPSLQTLNTEIGEDDYTRELVPPSAFQHLSEQDRKKKAMEWMERFDEHKLTLPIHNNEPQTPCPQDASRPTSFYKAMQSAVTNVSGFFSSDGNGTPKDTKLRPLKLSARKQTDGIVDTTSSVATPSRTGNKGHKHRLRDLTLVQKLYPPTPQTLSTLASQTPGSEYFVYRSPLAPPKQKRWKDLYSPSQLFGFREAAKADALDLNGHADKTSSVTDTTPAVTSRKHLFERPTLRAWNRDEATTTDLTHQKRNCSIVVLCICTLFPPLLLVYIFGGLNGIISWWTGGLYTSYAKSQKRLALIFSVAWGVAVFIGLVVFLALWFSRLR